MEKEKKEKTNVLEKKVSTLTMCVIVMGVLVLSLGGYLLYDKVGSKSNAEGSYIKANTTDTSGPLYCGATSSRWEGVIRIVNNEVPVYDDEKNLKQIATLNKGDELYNCFNLYDESKKKNYAICSSYVKLNTDKFVDGNFVVENIENCGNYVYLH